MNRQLLLEARHDARCLLRLCAAPHLEVNIRFWYSELLKERIAQFRVIMLPGMHQPIL